MYCVICSESCTYELCNMSEVLFCCSLGYSGIYQGIFRIPVQTGCVAYWHVKVADLDINGQQDAGSNGSLYIVTDPFPACVTESIRMCVTSACAADGARVVGAQLVEWPIGNVMCICRDGVCSTSCCGYGLLGVDVVAWGTSAACSVYCCGYNYPSVNVCSWGASGGCGLLPVTGAEACGYMFPSTDVCCWAGAGVGYTNACGLSLPNVHVCSWGSGCGYRPVCGLFDNCGYTLPQTHVTSWGNSTCGYQPVCSTLCNGWYHPVVDTCLWNGFQTASGPSGYPNVNVCCWNCVYVTTPPDVNVCQWRGSAAQSTTAGYPDVNVCLYLNCTIAGTFCFGTVYPHVDTCFWQGSAGPPDVNVACWDCTQVCGFVSSGVGHPRVSVEYWRDVSAQGSGYPEVNVEKWNNVTVPVPAVAGYPDINVKKWVGTDAPTPDNAGYPRVDVCYWKCRPVSGAYTGGVMYPFIETRRWLDNAVGTHLGLPCVAACVICDTIHGTGSISVDSDYGGTDNLSYIVDGGTAVEDALVQAYLKTEYDAGNRTRNYVKSETRTGAEGRWETEMRLNAGVYTLVYYKQGEYGPDIKEITVA